LVAHSFCDAFLFENDEIIVSEMEHHSNIVPWQMACTAKKAVLKVLPFNDDGVLNLEILPQLITEKTKLIAVNHVSNSLGTINPIREIINLAHQSNIPVLIDGAQAVAHLEVNVQELDCDFYCFSGHKMYAPMGVGVLYGKEKWLNAMPPYQGGGEMIKTVSFKGTVFNELPFKFEAGTPSVADVIGLGKALDFMESVGLKNMAEHEMKLHDYAMQALKSIPDIRFFGTAKDKVAVISFLVGAVHPYDLGSLLDKMGIAVRTGHHCTMPVMEHYGIPGTVRASFAAYNTEEEVQVFIEALDKVLKILR